MNPKKLIQLEPKFFDFQIEMEICFCKTRWSLLNLEKYKTSHLEGIPCEELEALDKQKFIEREAEMCSVFSREHKRHDEKFPCNKIKIQCPYNPGRSPFSG